MGLSGDGGGWGDVELISSPFWTYLGGRNTNKTKIIMAITCPLPVTYEREDMCSNSSPWDLKSPQENVCKKLPCSAYTCYHLVTSLRMKPTHGGGQSQENHILSSSLSCSCSEDRAGSLGFSSTRCPFSIVWCYVINTTFLHCTPVSGSLAIFSAGQRNTAWLHGGRICFRPLSMACR